MEFMIHLREIDIKQVTIQIGTWLKTVMCDISDRHLLKYSTTEVGNRFMEADWGTQAVLVNSMLSYI